VKPAQAQSSASRVVNGKRRGKLKRSTMAMIMMIKTVRVKRKRRRRKRRTVGRSIGVAMRRGIRARRTDEDEDEGLWRQTDSKAHLQAIYEKS
jgi:hypothetical protein